jgi:hypothetical protein
METIKMKPLPLVPEDLVRDHPKHMWRAAAVKVRSFIEGKPASLISKQLYPYDEITPAILRAATNPAKLTTPAWAGSLAAASVSSAVQETVSTSVIGRLMQAGGLSIDLGTFASVVVPGRATTPADAGLWLAEGEGIPARQYHLLGPTLQPHKLAVIVTFSREMSEASNIEDILRALIIEAAGPAIDAAILSTAAASPQRSAGLLNGLTPLVAATGAPSFDNCAEDLGKLLGDLASRNGGAHVFFAASASQAMAIRFFGAGQDTFPVSGSAVLPAGTVIAIEPSSFASTIIEPEFEVGTMATIHQDDTAPNITGAAASVKSMWQTDAIALKMTLWADWCMRAPHVAFMNNVNW